MLAGRDPLSDRIDHCSAFTVGELGEMLPYNYTALKHISTEKWFGVEFFMGGSAKSLDINAKNEADTRAKLLIFLIKAGLVKVGVEEKKMKRQSTTWALSKECEHCGRDLRTKKEWDQGQCNRCQEEYEEEMYAIYGDEWYV